jgi:hypothetical protein
MYGQEEHFLMRIKRVIKRVSSSATQLCKQDLATMASHNPLHNLCKDQVV